MAHPGEQDLEMAEMEKCISDHIILKYLRIHLGSSNIHQQQGQCRS